MIRIIEKYFVPIVILIITVLTFYKIVIHSQFPYPGDLLVSFNFPWYSGDWEGYNPWTTHKEFVAMDSIRQHLPWHKLTFAEFKENFSLPLWNPYNFSGNPHLGNIQTFIFNPFNIILLLLPLFEGWIIFVILQIPLTITFTYLFARSLSLGKGASMLSGVAFAFSSYYLYWLEIGIVGHSILWLPLILFSVQKLSVKPQIKYVVLLTIATSATIFSGHIQTAVFVFIMSAFFLILKLASTKHPARNKIIIATAISMVLVALITAVQTLPALELYINSPLTEPLSKKIFSENYAPFHKFLTLLAQDFFGNPSTANFWSVHYGDGTFHIGTVPIFFAVVALLFSRKIETRFFAVAAFLMVLYVTKSPLFLLLQKVNIPFLTGTTPLRETFLLCFSLAMLAGIGIDEFQKNVKIKKKTYLLMLFFFLIYLLLFLFTYVGSSLLGKEELHANLLISRRNLIIPFLAFLTLPTSLFIYNLVSRAKLIRGSKDIWVWSAVVVTALVGIYQFNKVNPSSSKEFFYPEHKIFSWIRDNGSINRFRGESTAFTWDNISAYFNIYSAEGYGVFRLKRYAELFASQDTKNLNKDYERSVAFFTENNRTSRNRLYDLTGVKYLLLKDDFARDARENDPDKQDGTDLAWQDGKFKIYERTSVLPRFWMTSSYKVANDQEIIENIYDPTFDLKTVQLEKEPGIVIDQQSASSANINLISYRPNSISFDISSESNNLFFISDAYFPGWNAYVDGKKTNILRAHYAFRAVPIPANTQMLEMKYEPVTVKIGTVLTIFGVAGLFAIPMVQKKNKIR